MKPRLTREQAHAKYKELIAEKNEIKAFLDEAARKEKRLKELLNSWNCRGEIELAFREARDSVFPTWAEDNYNRTLIVAVDDKWITLRSEGDDEDRAKRYSRATGRRERIKSDYDKIDVSRAVELWEKTACLRTTHAAS
jgi:hypothetical protein